MGGLNTSEANNQLGVGETVVAEYGRSSKEAAMQALVLAVAVLFMIIILEYSQTHSRYFNLYSYLTFLLYTLLAFYVFWKLIHTPRIYLTNQRVMVRFGHGKAGPQFSSLMLPKISQVTIYQGTMGKLTNQYEISIEPKSPANIMAPFSLLYTPNVITFSWFRSEQDAKDFKSKIDNLRSAA